MYIIDKKNKKNKARKSNFMGPLNEFDLFWQWSNNTHVPQLD